MGPLWPIGGNMQHKSTTRKIVITGLLLALMIVLQTIGNFVQIGPANINLSLVAVVLAGVICGPVSGAILGFFNGVMALLSPSTLALFMPINPVGTVVVCLLKCTLAGLEAGFIFKLFKKKNSLLGLILASISVPVVNTGTFCIGCLIFFRSFLESGVGTQFPNIGAFLIFGVIGWNFLLEIGTTTVFTPIIGTILLKKESIEQ